MEDGAVAPMEATFEYEAALMIEQMPPGQRAMLTRVQVLVRM